MSSTAIISATDTRRSRAEGFTAEHPDTGGEGPVSVHRPPETARRSTGADLRLNAVHRRGRISRPSPHHLLPLHPIAFAATFCRRSKPQRSQNNLLATPTLIHRPVARATSTADRGTSASGTRRPLGATYRRRPRPSASPAALDPSPARAHSGDDSVTGGLHSVPDGIETDLAPRIDCDPAGRRVGVYSGDTGESADLCPDFGSATATGHSGDCDDRGTHIFFLSIG